MALELKIIQRSLTAHTLLLYIKPANETPGLNKTLFARCKKQFHVRARCSDLLDKNAGELSVEIRDGSPRNRTSPARSPRGSPHRTHGGGGGWKRRAVVRGVQSTLSKTSMLANFLPTSTLLTFEMLLPAASGDGSCSAVSVAMLRALLALCAASCFLFHFTDSFRAPDGRVYYGFVTTRGLSLFRTGLGVEVPREDKLRLGFVDVVHAVMSVLVFAAIAFSDYRVSGCLFPGHRKEMDEVVESFPLMVGAVCSGLFLVFPDTRCRYGIGCTAAAWSSRALNKTLLAV